MSTSIIDLQRGILLNAFKTTGQTTDKTTGEKRDQWKMLVCDEKSKQLLDNVATEDDVLKCHVLGILQIEDARETLSDTNAIYFLTPTPHIVEVLKADLIRKRYLRAYLIWTSHLRGDLEQSIKRLQPKYHDEEGKEEDSYALNIDFFARESHVVTFRDPDSFQFLYNPSCKGLIQQHLQNLTQKIVSVCVSLGEYPLVRYYQPQKKYHAALWCAKLAESVQAAINEITPKPLPPSPRPRATLLITDRSMDLMAPLVHELTYQAMAMDLLPMQEENDKIADWHTIRRGESEQKKEEEKTQLTEKDKLWVENRHLHMKDLLVKLSVDFRKFQAKNSQFADADGQTISVNTIKDMLAGLNEFTQGKEAFSLHIDMAEKCAKLFQDQNLMSVTSVEQLLATGFDEQNKPPKNLTDQLVRLLDDKSVTPEDRARLLIMYIIYRGGILLGDTDKLLEHGHLPPGVYGVIIYNLPYLGATVKRVLLPKSEQPPPYMPLYESKQVASREGEEISLSRFEPILRHALEETCQGNLNSVNFPYANPDLDGQGQQGGAVQTSLRSAGKPTWANTRPSANKPRQRIIVFMAGGATYSEARTCYDLSLQTGKDIFLTTTHMLTPKSFLSQLSRLYEPREALNLAIDNRPQIPGWMTEPPQQPRPQHRPAGAQPLTEAMQNINLGPPKSSNSSSQPASSKISTPPSTGGSFSTPTELANSGKLKKEKKEKKSGLGGIFRKH